MGIHLRNKEKIREPEPICPPIAHKLLMELEELEKQAISSTQIKFYPPKFTSIQTLKKDILKVLNQGINIEVIKMSKEEAEALVRDFKALIYDMGYSKRIMPVDNIDNLKILGIPIEYF